MNYAKKTVKYLHMSQKSSTFAPAFEKKPRRGVEQW